MRDLTLSNCSSSGDLAAGFWSRSDHEPIADFRSVDIEDHLTLAKPCSTLGFNAFGFNALLFAPLLFFEDFLLLITLVVLPLNSMVLISL